MRVSRAQVMMKGNELNEQMNKMNNDNDFMNV